MGPPEEIVRGLLFARLLEPENERSLRVHPAKNMANDAVLPGGIECLQDHKEGLASVRIEQVLQLVHACGVFLDLRHSLLVAFVLTHVGGVDLRQTDLSARFDNEFFSIVHSNLPLRCCLHSQLVSKVKVLLHKTLWQSCNH